MPVSIILTEFQGAASFRVWQI